MAERKQADYLQTPESTEVSIQSLQSPIQAQPAQPAQPVAGKDKQIFNKMMDIASDAATKTNGVFSGISTRVIAIAIVGLVVTAGVAFYLYYVLYYNVVGRSIVTLPDTQKPLLGTVLTQANGKIIANSGNGKRLTMAFWMYINDLSAFRNMYRHVLHRGDKTIQNASPLVYLDKNTNKLNVRFETDSLIAVDHPTSMSTPYVNENNIVSGSATSNTSSTSRTNVYTGIDEANKVKLDLVCRGITIDYVPIQRWVHVAVIVNEEVNRGTISAYLDGELVKVVTSDIKVRVSTFANNGVSGATTENEFNYLFQNLVIDKGGDIWIGGSSNEPTLGPGFDGLVSGVLFANYDMNAKDIFDIYMRGPVSSPLSRIGLGSYGMRAPIYKIA